MSATDDVLFINNSNKHVKTYAGILLEYLLNIGKKNKNKLY